MPSLAPVNLTPDNRVQALTPRQLEVLGLITQGLSNKEIARELGLSEATVKFHLKNIFAKLGVSRRGMAVSVSKHLKLTEPK